MKNIMKFISSVISAGMFFSVIIAIVLISSLWEYSSQLPDYRQLEKYEPKVTTRLFAGDGQLLMEYATQKRIFLPVDKIPDRVKHAFFAAEDKNFYSHWGIDVFGILRAIVSNVKQFGSGKRPGGASTITQQVAKNFLLSSELSIKRKIKEALLAIKIEQAFSKDHILELYLNEIYLGNRSYGVAAAALNYFNKSVNELTVPEAAYLAALPKGPNNYNPKTKYDAAITRRNWVIDRMSEEGFITEQEALEAKNTPLEVVDRADEFVSNAKYFSEEVRKQIAAKFGEDALYEGGLIVRTTVDPKLQNIATKVLRKQLEAYDTRHGWRGAVTNMPLNENYLEEFRKFQMPKGADKTWQKAIVTKVERYNAYVTLEDETEGIINLSVLEWAKEPLKEQKTGPAPQSVSQVLNLGDVIFVQKMDEQTIAKKKLPENSYYLKQLPKVEGALLAMDPHTGRVLALVGGYDFEKSEFNRAFQAVRQTGSSFKPFVYLAALDNGYSPTDLILDAPFIFDQGPGLPKWKPVNYSTKFYGLTTLRQGVEKSRNLMTVRLAQALGMKIVAEYAKNLGVNDELPELLSMSLGAGDTKLVKMVNAYALFVNGGKQIAPYLIERIQDRNGKTILKHDKRVCPQCKATEYTKQNVPELTDEREQLIDPLSAYQMTSILEGVVQRGTGIRLKWLNRHLAGKTGTTNQSKDAWFIGFSPDLIVGTYVGFDEPSTLGKKETGSSIAVPIFYDFMKEALKDTPNLPFRIPSGIKLTRVNYHTGKPATPLDDNVILEAIKPEMDLEKQPQKIIGDEEEATELSGTKTMFDTKTQNSDLQIGGQY